MTKSFDVFLSHNSKDKPAVRELAEALRARGLNVWLDEWELVPGRPWQEALEEVIETTGASVVLVGKDGLGPWQDREMRSCLNEFVRRQLPVIPVLLPNAPEQPKLPMFLNEFTWVDLRAGLTEEGIDRLQWGVMGKRPDLSASAAAPNTNLESFAERLTGIRFLWIPGGRFEMGGHAYGERPIHWVRISPFWIAETPVTNRQYAVFLKQTGAPEPAYWRDLGYSSTDQPVTGVNWNDAQAFCRWLSEKSGPKVVLPSEAQWEFAARGADGKEYPWGNESPDGSRACFAAGRPGPAPVGSYPAGRGPFGTLDQAGNVWEWCRDLLYVQAYAKVAKEGEPVDPVEEDVLEGEKVVRVIRGGGWSSPAGLLRAACRNGKSAGDCSNDIGFRVAAIPREP